MKKIFVINKSNHDFSAAEKFGELIFMTEGKINRYSTNHMLRLFSEALKESKKDDYILLCSLNVMNSLACAVFAYIHGTINLLLFKNGDYVERNHTLYE